MNICFYGAIDCTGRACGVSKVTKILAAIFRRHGHCVYIVATYPNDKPQVEEDSPFVFLSEGKLYSPKNIEFLHQFCLEKKIHVLINQENTDALEETFYMLRERGVKVFSCIHCQPTISLTNIQDRTAGNSLRQNFLQKMFAFPCVKILNFLKYRKNYRIQREEFNAFIDQSDCVVLLSDSLKASFESLCDRSAAALKQKLRAIPNPLPLKETKPVASSNVERQKIVLWVGRLTWRAKRPDRMLLIWRKIAAQCPEWTLQILGDGKKREDLEAYVRENRIPNVQFCGQVNTEKYYSQAEILCSTSTSEGFGMVLVEALKHGVVPMVFDAFPSAREIISHEKNGILVPPFSLKEYSRQLLYLIQHPEYREALRNSSCNTLDRFSPETIYSQWEVLFREFGCPVD